MTRLFVVESLIGRVLGSAVFLALFMLFFAPILLGIRNIGTLAGMVVSLFGIAFFAFNPLVSGLLKRIWEHSIGHVILCILMGFLCLASVYAVTISGCMIFKMNSIPREENVVVVLGCKVRNGSPSLMLLHRLEAAEAYLKEHPEVPVIVCGGQGADESMSEAQCMYEYLTEHGIDAERIYREDTSTSTIENLQNAQGILEEHGWGDRVTIVTDGYHQLRASMIAQSIDLKTDHISAKTSWYLVPIYWVREWFGICYQLIFG